MTISSPAVAERPRDASRLSVARFDSTKRRARSFIVSRVLPIQIYRCVYASQIRFCLLLFVVVVHAVCDTQMFTDASPSVR